MSALLRRLERDFSGPLRVPGEPGYDRRRQAPYAAIDPRPLVIAEAVGPADVRAAVRAAKDEALPLAVQATGHGTHVPCDGGVLLRTSDMRTVLVDPGRRIARVGAGAVWHDVLRACAPFGLATLSGSHHTVSVTGYTLGGGMSWLSRRYGFAADSVLRADVVTADGRLVTATADDHPDLFWALRGGGGAFGAVTSLEFRLYPVGEVVAGTIHFPFEATADTLAYYRDWAADAPDELSTAVHIVSRPYGPPHVPSLAILAMYEGESGRAERHLRALLKKAGPPLHEDFGVRPFAEVSLGGLPAEHFDYYLALPDDLIDTLVSHAELSETIEIRHWGGAIARPGPDAGPAGHRSAPFSVLIDTWAPELAEALRPHGVGGSFVNFHKHPDVPYSPFTEDNHRRLAEVKQIYDPQDMFRFTVSRNVANAARSKASAGPSGSLESRTATTLSRSASSMHAPPEPPL